MRGGPEEELRERWEHRLAGAGPLTTSDGQPVIILSPGDFNVDGGPDVIDAHLRIGGRNFRGDIEFHVSPLDWVRHGHDCDPHYNRVILHVVACSDGRTPPTRTASKRLVPVLTMQDQPDAAEHIPSGLRPHATVDPHPSGPSCANSVTGLSPGSLRRRLIHLGWDRLQFRSRELEERLRRILAEERCVVCEPHLRFGEGDCADIPIPEDRWTRRELLAPGPWEQLVYEGVMEGLGYATNRRSMRALAENIPLRLLRRWNPEDADSMQAILFGAAGLLPSSRTLPEKESRVYVRRLRRQWRDIRRRIHRPMLHEADWLFFRLRPANFPTARLAAMALLLPRVFGGGCMRRMFGCFAPGPATPAERIRALQNMFRFEPDAYWAHHLHFRGSGTPRGIALGIDRINVIITNTLIPAALAYARISGFQPIVRQARAMALSLPGSSSNATTRRMERILSHGTVIRSSALVQQGMLHVWKEFCRKVNCRECVIGTTTKTHKGPSGKAETDRPS